MNDKIQEALKLALAFQEPGVNSGSVTAVKLLAEAVLDLYKETQSKQAKIDSLMLEYCPEEMTKEQREEWGKHQVMHDPIAERIAALVNERFGPYYVYNFRDTPFNDLGLDDIDRVELVMLVEDEFDFEFGDADAEAATSVNALAELVRKL